MFVETLLEEGRFSDASEYIEKTERILGSVDSRKILKVLKERIKLNVDNNYAVNDINFHQPYTGFKENEVKGVLVCTQDQIRFLYRLEIRRKGRHSYSTALISFNVSDNSSNKDVIMEKIFNILAIALRKGDALCRWNKNQFLIILFNVNYDSAGKIIARIRDEYNKIRKPYEPLLNSNIIEVV